MKVELAAKAKRQLFRLDNLQRQRIIRKLRTLENLPFMGKLLSGELYGIYSLRAWPYRILYQVDKKLKKITVLTVEHRQGAYK